MRTNIFVSWLKLVGLLLLSAAIYFSVEVNAAFAHTPHDDIYQIEISPNYHQDQTLFIIVRGNLFKSEDGGSSWQRLVKGLDHQYGLSALDISSQTSNTLFLTTKGDGIYKSEDGGSSWLKVNQGLEALDIDLVAISAKNPEVVLAAGTEGGLYKTENGGENWEKVISDIKVTAITYFPEHKDQIVIGDRQGNLYLSKDEGYNWQPLVNIANSGEIRAIALSPNFVSDKTLYVGTEKAGILKSVDGGISFSKVNRDLSDKSIVSLSVSPTSRTDYTLFASTWHEVFFQSNDKGRSWKKYHKGLTTDPQAAEFKRPNFSDLEISNSDEKTMFLAGYDGLFKSTNGGRNWQEVDTLSSIIVDLELSPDYNNDSTVVVGTYLWGHYLSNDGGATWKPINKGAEEGRPNGIVRVFDIVFSPNYSEDNTIFSTTWYRLLKSTNRGKYWQEFNPMGKSEKFTLAVSPSFASDRMIYLGTQKGRILRSIDGGKNFSRIGNLGQDVYSLLISPNFSVDRTIFAGVRDGVFKTVDGGATWRSAGEGIATEESEAPILTISPSYKVDRTIFAGSSQGVFKTEDGGQSWERLAGDTYGNNVHIEAIALSPDYQTDRTLIVSSRGKGLFKSIDGGNTFSKIGDDLLDNNHLLSNTIGFPPVGASMPIKFSPLYSIDQTIYGFSGTKLLKSENGGNTWETIIIPTPKYNFSTNLYLAYLHSRKSTKRVFGAALIFALIIYLLIGYLRLEKRLPFNKLQIKTGIALGAFLIAFTFLSNG